LLVRQVTRGAGQRAAPAPLVSRWAISIHSFSALR
jgi:hypothetical protein